jgi:hypothetical protein
MPFQAELSIDSSDMSLFNMDVSELFTVSKLAAAFAIAADSAFVWATPDVTPLSRLGCVGLLAWHPRPRWTVATGHR